MPKFITGEALEKAVYEIIWDAEDSLRIVSPFIRLDDYFKKLFDKHINNPKLHILIVFGKNEGNVSRSLSKDDFDYFTKFPNISIIYVPNLHGKYYGNEKKGVITSINLHDYSFKSNIEFGVYSEINMLDRFTQSADQDAWAACSDIAYSNEAIYIRRPVFEKKLLSAILGKSYVKSDTLHDITNNFYLGFANYSRGNIQKRLSDFPDELDLATSTTKKDMPIREEIQQTTPGYCIRTGIKISFDPNKPLSEDAFRSWVQFGNTEYPENYCHFSGEPSNGTTCFSKPILSKNWSKAKPFMNSKNSRSF